MSFFTRFSLKNSAAIAILCILVVIGGIYSGLDLKKEQMPDMTFPIVAVITAYPGASPSDIHDKITKPLENLISSVEGIENVTSTSSENVSAIIIQFDFSADMDASQRKIEETIKNITVPEGAIAPKVSRFNFNSMPILRVSISNDQVASEELERKVEDNVLPSLSGISGVAQVQTASDSQKSVYVKLLPEKLKEYSLTSQQIMQLLKANNVTFPAGSVSLKGTVEPIRVTGKINTLDELKNLQLTVMQKVPAALTAPSSQMPANSAMSVPKQISLADIAEISVGSGDSTSFSRMNGNPGVLLQVYKTQAANTVDVSDAAQTKLEEIKSTLPAGTVYDVIDDGAIIVKESISGMVKEGLLGALFAFLVILLFLRNFRSTLIAVVSIPLSVLITLVFLKQFNITLNILTLGGLSVATGRIVDDSIVVIENIFRRLHTDDARDAELIKASTKEVTSAITSSTLTTVAVFLPIGLISGFAGVMFRPFAITVAIALLSSLLVAVTVIPLMSKVLLLKTKRIKHQEPKEGRLIKKYTGLLSWALNHKGLTFIITSVLLVGSLALLPLIGTSFIPAATAKKLNITIDYPAGTDIQIVNKKAEEIEKLLANNEDVEQYQTTVVSSASNSNAMAALMSQTPGSIAVKLKEDANVNSVMKDLKDLILPKADKAIIDIQQAQDSQGGEGGGMNSIQVMVVGDDIAKIKQGAELLTNELSSIEGLDQIKNNLSDSKPEIAIAVDQKKASVYALSAAQVGMSVRELLNDNVVTTLFVDNKSLDVRLGLKFDSVNTLDDIKAIAIQAPMGSVRLADIATVQEGPGAVSITTSDGRQYANVSALITEKDTGAVSKEVQTKLDSIVMPNGVKTEMGGVTQMMGDTFKQMGIAMLVAIFAVFLVMLIGLGGATPALAILFSLPLAAIGSFVALFVTGIVLDAPAMIGVLMLIGIVVTNAIVLIDRVQHSRKTGVSVREALMDAGKIRMRPILMTAIATIAALMPLAFGFSEGTMISQSLAVVVIGGLATSTLLTLVIVPVAYEMLETIKTRIFVQEKAA